MARQHEFVLDFQYFKSPAPSNRILLKEVAICSVYSNFSQSWLVKAPCSLKKLAAKFRVSGEYIRQTDYIREHIHGLDWYNGYTSFTDCVKNLRAICSSAKVVFVKGNAIAQFVRKSIFSDSVAVIDLEKWMIPPYVTMHNYITADKNGETCEPLCFYFPHIDKYCAPYQLNCSVKRAWVFASWISLLNQFAEIVSPVQIKADSSDSARDECFRYINDDVIQEYEQKYVYLSAAFYEKVTDGPHDTEFVENSIENTNENGEKISFAAENCNLHKFTFAEDSTTDDESLIEIAVQAEEISP
jgi:hypothetical protein